MKPKLSLKTHRFTAPVTPTLLQHRRKIVRKRLTRSQRNVAFNAAPPGVAPIAPIKAWTSYRATWVALERTKLRLNASS